MERGSNQDGFSLLELLVASSIFFTFMVGMAVMFSHSHRSFSRGQDRIHAQQSARIAARSMSAGIRLAGYDPSQAVEYLGVTSPIRVADAARLTIVADIDGNGVSDQVTYRLAGDNLVRDLATWEGTEFGKVETSELAEGISKLEFSYFDGAAPFNNTLAAPVSAAGVERVQRISVDLLASHNGLTGEQQFPMTVNIKLRNVPPPASGADDESVDE